LVISFHFEQEDWESSDSYSKLHLPYTRGPRS
jgi:hypothetical protein